MNVTLYFIYLGEVGLNKRQLCFFKRFLKTFMRKAKMSQKQNFNVQNKKKKIKTQHSEKLKRFKTKVNF